MLLFLPPRDREFFGPGQEFQLQRTYFLHLRSGPLYYIYLFFDRAKFHTHTSVYMAHFWPRETILLSICLEHEKMLGDILSKLKERTS
jgi:hypothetical protein